MKDFFDTNNIERKGSLFSGFFLCILGAIGFFFRNSEKISDRKKFLTITKIITALGFVFMLFSVDKNLTPVIEEKDDFEDDEEDWMEDDEDWDVDLIDIQRKPTKEKITVIDGEKKSKKNK